MLLSNYQYLSFEKRNYAHDQLSLRNHAWMIDMIVQSLALIAQSVVSFKMIIVSQLYYHENQTNTQIVKCNDNSINYT